MGIGHPPYSNNRSLKNDTNNFATVTANTGNMIVSNTPMVAKKDSVVAVGSSQALKNQRLNNNSNCFSEPKNIVTSSKGKTHSQSSKSHQQNHHTLQCISDINEFKQKINMVLQTQAFPNKVTGTQPVDVIPTKQMASNAPGSLNPSSRIGYQNSKHESPTPNLNKNQFFQKRKVQKQNGLNQLGQIYDITDSKNEQIINSAFQSFKQNLKQQHQHFIKSTNTQQAAGILLDQVFDNRSHGSNQQFQQQPEQVKVAQGGTYLLRNQKDKNRGQFQYQQNGHIPFGGNGDFGKGKDIEAEMPQFLRDAGMHQKQMINGQLYTNQGQPISTSLTQKGYISSMVNQQPVFQQNTDAQKANQRRKLLLEYGQDQTTPETKQNNQSPEITSASSRRKRSSVHSQIEQRVSQPSDFFLTLQSLNLEILEEKDRESLRQFSQQYLADLQEYLELKKEVDEHGNTKLLTDLATQNLLNSREGGFSSGHKSAGPSAVVNEHKLSTPHRPTEAAEPDTSAEKFKQNEKNLKEERLRKESTLELALQGKAGEEAQKLKPAAAESSLVSGDLSHSTNLKRNVSQKHFGTIKSNEMTETEPNILFKTENNRLKQMLESQNPGKEMNIDDGAAEDSLKFKNCLSELVVYKIRILNQLIEELDKPKAVNRTVLKGHHVHASVSDVKPIQPKENGGPNDWVQGLLPIQMFLASLNCPKPSPQQINVMNNSKQRLDLFKILQAREHVKFTNIQSEKMLQLHQKLENELELKLQSELKESRSEKQKSELMNQFQHKQVQQINNLQQLKTLRKQQQNDQKAFSIFQMNELAQFRSMSDGQQKQILLNNLQQGKFDEFENLLDPIALANGKAAQTTQSTADGTSINNSSKLSKTGGKSLEQTTENQKKLRNVRQTLDEQNRPSIELKTDETTNPKTNAEVTQRKSMIAPGPESSKDGMAGGPSSVRMIRHYKNNVQSEQVTQRPPNPADALHVIRKRDIEQIQRNFEASESKFRSALKEQMLKQQKLKIFYQQMSEAFINYVHTNKYYQQIQTVGQIDNTLPYLPRGTMTGSTNHSDFDERTRQRIKARQSMALNNANGSRAIDRTKSKQAINSNTKDDKKKDGKEQAAAEKTNEQTASTAPASAETKDPVATEPKKEDGESGEEPVQEVKKPRYFPPKKLPNPFENAAQEQEKFLQARKEALAKYSQISKNRFKQDENAPLKYVIRPGNNSKLIQRVFEKSGRIDVKYDNEGNISCPGWETADDYYDSLYNFKWKPTSAGIKFDLISKHGLKQLVNHIKGHYQLTTKDNLFLNLKAYYESQKVNIYDHVPLTIVLDYLKDDVGDRVETFANILKLIDKNLDQDIDTINGRLQEMQIQREKTVKSQYKITRCSHDRQNLWLLKPTGFNRGIGIHIFQNFDQLKDIMCTYYGIGRGSKDKVSIFQTHKQNHVSREYVDQNGEKQHRNFSFVIQKLIERPLLYLNRKFDIRTWVLLTSADGKVYVFRESYVRTSSKEYTEYNPDLASEEQIFMQLTNNAVQKEGADYGKFEEGNILSLDTLFNFVSHSEYAKGRSKAQLKEKFLEESQRFIADSMKAVRGKIVHQKYTFELFGYDFIIDEDLNTTLIEVNTNPCLEESNTLLRNMLPRMIDDLLNLTMDPLFFPTEANKYKSAYPLPGSVFSGSGGEFVDSCPHPGFKDSENLFRHIYTIEQ